MMRPLHQLVAVAAICASAGRGHSIDGDYMQERERRHTEHEKAMSKKQAVREQIRARRAAQKAKQ